MPFAIVQKDLTAPEVEQLKRACRVLPTLTDLDAQTMFNDAYGVLTKGLDEVEARALQESMLEEGIDTAVVSEADLPPVPPAAKIVRSIELFPTHLLLRDPMGRELDLPWSDVMLVAAGNVKVLEFRKTKSTHDEPAFHGAGISGDTIGEGSAREESHYHFLLELVRTGGAARYSVPADDFVFRHLGPRQTKSLRTNFTQLVRELAQFAPHAGLNRGAWSLCQEAGELFTYPSKAAFFEEITWMLWRTAQLRPGV